MKKENKNIQSVNKVDESKLENSIHESAEKELDNSNFDNDENNNLEKTYQEELVFDENEEIQPAKKGSIMLMNKPTNDRDSTPDYSEIQIKRREEIEKIQIRKTQANLFEKYLNDTGINSAFELIFSEMITKKIPCEDHYSYSAGRLRQIGREIEILRQKNK
jgi:hypothetical protein